MGSPRQPAIEVIEAHGLAPRLTDPHAIIAQAKRITEDDVTGATHGLRPDIAFAAVVVFYGAAKEGWRPVFYVWPDFTVGWLSHEPSDAELVAAYAEWRETLEFHVAPPQGRA
ncbi:MAG: hypothetical protein NT042_08445 [Sulfuritalea sp.]|nr:hypothetical protein [Sulfuritalea sp.]